MVIMKKTIITSLVFFTLTGLLIGCYDQTGAEDGDSRNAARQVEVKAWPDGKIPYAVEATLPERDLDYLKLAMEEWAQYCNIEFIDYTGREDRPESTLIINYTDGQAETTVGYAKNPRLAIPTESKLYQRHYVHLLGHILGLLKEHQRPDRDLYITVHWENIAPEAMSQYEKLDSTLITEEDFMYDTASVMHYTRTQGNKAFGLRSFDYVSGEEYTRAFYVSTGDAEKVAFIYGAPVAQ
ncbi:MAG: hypothetical protein CVV44_02095 [Spirochaetae bacterium HGW-Spirochaetae-1]|jgi:hypothetical protein|nr:MAG: hypothetical protein CVV44_02095 [Spirochaetae bacterium HGW-Spirochaetae-1]